MAELPNVEKVCQTCSNFGCPAYGKAEETEDCWMPYPHKTNPVKKNNQCDTCGHETCVLREAKNWMPTLCLKYTPKPSPVLGETDKIAGLTRKEFIALPMKERHKRLEEQAKEFVKNHGYLPDDPCDGHSTMIESKPAGNIFRCETCAHYTIQYDIGVTCDDTVECDPNYSGWQSKPSPVLGGTVLKEYTKYETEGFITGGFTPDELWLITKQNVYTRRKVAEVLQTKLNRAREGLKALPNPASEFWKGYWMGQIEILDNAIAELEGK